MTHIKMKQKKGAENASFLRIAKMEDAPYILEIYNDAVKTGFSCGHLSEVTLITVIDWLEDSSDKRPTWVIESNQKIIAWFSIQDFYGLPAFNQAVEVGIYVSQPAQHQGLASMALAFLDEFVISIGASHLIACIYEHNTNSLRLFKKNQYQQWGCLPQVASINHKRYDLLLLGKQLF